MGNLVAGNAFRIIYITVGTGDRYNFCAKFGGFQSRTPGNVAETGNGNRFAFDIHPFCGEHALPK